VAVDNLGIEEEGGKCGWGKREAGSRSLKKTLSVERHMTQETGFKRRLSNDSQWSGRMGRAATKKNSVEGEGGT